MVPEVNSCWIGIQGGTCAGKTTLAHALAERFGPEELLVVGLDLFYRPVDEKHLIGSGAINFDTPESLDWELIRHVTQTLRSGNSTAINTYDGITVSGTIPLTPKRYTVVEGLWVFNDQDLSDLFDLKIYVETSPDVRLIRRLTRDVMTTKEWTLDQLLSYYMEYIRPMHMKFVEPGKAACDMAVSGEDDIDAEVNRVLERLNQL
jgi:uridine kinase